ncbi:hypothetical protein [Streptomyces sp. TE5632]
MLGRQQALVVETIVDLLDDRRVVDRGIGGDDVGDHVRAPGLSGVVAGLAEVNLVTVPAGPALDGIA